MFYGMPIHIIRDVAITVRSFYKRISDFIRYRQATKDMNTRYPDATADEIHKEDVCIICREAMYASQWLYDAPGSQNSQSRLGANHQRRNRHNIANDANLAGDERLRPKKLPCGHILHCTCLRSWLERQQNCPICRAPVIISNSATTRSRSDNRTRDLRAQENRPQVNDQIRGEAPQLNVGRNTFSFGPFRLSFGVRHGAARDFNNTNRANLQLPARAVRGLQQRRNSLERLRQASSVHEQVAANVSSSPQAQLLQLEQQLSGEIRSLGAHATQLFLVRVLEAELARLRMEMNRESLASAERLNLFQPIAMDPLQGSQLHRSTHISASNDENQNLMATQQGLPNGLVIPHGWSVILLHRVEDHGVTTSAISPVPRFNNLAFAESQTHRLVQPAFSSQPTIVDSLTAKNQNMSLKTKIHAKGNITDLLALNNLADTWSSCPDEADAKSQVVRLWNEEKAQPKNVLKDSNSRSRNIIDHDQNIVHSRISSKVISTADLSQDSKIQINKPTNSNNEEIAN